MIDFTGKSVVLKTLDEVVRDDIGLLSPGITDGMKEYFGKKVCVFIHYKDNRYLFLIKDDNFYTWHTAWIKQPVVVDNTML